jgi:hypothetical protein
LNWWKMFLKPIWALKSVFDPKIMDFENVPITKVIHIYGIERMNA